MIESKTDKHPLVLALIYIGFLISGIFIAQFLIFLALAPFLGTKIVELGIIFTNPNAYPEYKNVLLFVQGMNTLVGMIVATYFFERNFYRNKIHFSAQSPQELYIFGAILAVIFAMPAITWIAEINQNMVFPAFLKEFETWAMQKESELKILTEYITFFNSTPQFVFGFIVIAIIPAIGEELVFRGVFQSFFHYWSKNSHFAIWISAILFSAIHFQFYGFVPRMLLGALFGYLYFWTGNILVPIAGHLANNGFSLLLLHLKNQNLLKIDVETTAQMPTSMLIGSAIFFCAIIFFIYWHIQTMDLQSAEE